MLYAGLKFTGLALNVAADLAKAVRQDAEKMMKEMEADAAAKVTGCTLLVCESETVIYCFGCSVCLVLCARLVLLLWLRPLPVQCACTNIQVWLQQLAFGSQPCFC